MRPYTAAIAIVLLVAVTATFIYTTPYSGTTDSAAVEINGADSVDTSSDTDGAKTSSSGGKSPVSVLKATMRACLNSGKAVARWAATVALVVVRAAVVALVT